MSTAGVGAVAALLEERHGLRFDGAGEQRLARGVRETARWAGTAPEALARRWPRTRPPSATSSTG
jgi:hypothetical protein